MEIKLKLIEEKEQKEEEVMESNIHSELGGEIENLEFPEFGGGEGRVVEGIEKEMVIFRASMEEWK